MRRVLLVAAAFALSASVGQASPKAGPRTYTVAHHGSDAAAGTVDAPWRTLAHAVPRLRPGDTLIIRGSTSPDTNTACARDGDQGGACWTEVAPCVNGTRRCSPLQWSEGDSHWAGRRGRPITIAAIPGETVIIEPSTGRNVVMLEARAGAPGRAQVDAAHCSYLTFDGLILDGRNQTGDVFRVDPRTGNTDPPSTYCAHVTLRNGKIRHGHSNGGIAAYTYRGAYENLEVYENGANPTSFDHDHGVYLHAQHNVFTGGRVHHNIQGIQIENPASDRLPRWRGDAVLRGIEVDHNGVNPFAGWADTGPGPFVRRNSAPANGDIQLFTKDASYTLVEACNVHDNTWYGVTLTGQWGSPPGCGLPTHHVTVRNNHIWGNGTADGTKAKYDAVQLCSKNTTSIIERNVNAPRRPSPGTVVR